MKVSAVLAGFLVPAMAGLVLGQTDAKLPPGTKMQVQEQKAGGVNQALKDKIASMPTVNSPDGLQCLLKRQGELTAAYAKAAGSGCKKVKAAQKSEYYCGTCDSPESANCLASSEKIQAILNGCRLKPPQHTPTPGPDGFPIDTPGCNSLGILCACDGPVPYALGQPASGGLWTLTKP